MPALHVRDVPDEVYEALRRRAQEQGRSISAETISILKSAVSERLMARAQVRQRIDERRVRRGELAVDAAALIREGRDR